ncbi:MAG: 2-C-methyl-D-erythritol 4-phosphate cytidylyltransferase [Desulfobacteraceae bacterium]|nr:2-C-methyl-D-erythritol 4-phosphate cytidylyltransferase [Desulfobacteraceae bacterium]
MGKISWEKEFPCQGNCPICVDMKTHFAVIVAAGSGLRMSSETKKQYMLLSGIPILTRTAMAFCAIEDVGKIILVVPANDMEYCKSEMIEPYGLSNRIDIIAGGNQRQDSVFNGLSYIRNTLTAGTDAVVLIHDGVRPFVHREIIKNCIKNVTPSEACVPGIGIADTVKQVLPDLSVQRTISREYLYLIQTPQCFYLNPILAAFEYAIKTSFWGTDDASIFEHFGGKVQVIKGSKLNIKITTPEDLTLGELYLSKIQG